MFPVRHPQPLYCGVDERLTALRPHRVVDFFSVTPSREITSLKYLERKNNEKIVERL